MELGEMVKEFRKQHGLSQRQFADMVGLSNQQISNIERGCNSKGEEFTPNMATYNKLAAAMYMSVAELILETADEIPLNPVDLQLSDDEMKLIYCYRNADAEMKDAIMTLLSRYDKKDIASSAG